MRVTGYAAARQAAVAASVLIAVVSVLAALSIDEQRRSAMQARVEEERQRRAAEEQRVLAEDSRKAAIVFAEEAVRARTVAENAVKESETKRQMAEVRRVEAEKLAERARQEIERATESAVNAQNEWKIANREKQEADEALAKARAAQAKLEKAQSELAQAASKAYLDLSKHFVEQGDFEQALTNLRGASELGIVTNEHLKLFKELYEKPANQSDDTASLTSKELKQKVGRSLAGILEYQARAESDVDAKTDLLEQAATYDALEKAKYLTEAAKLQEDAAQKQFMLATVESYDVAVKRFQKAIKLNPRRLGDLNREIARANYNSGVLEFQNSRFDEAIRRYSEAIALKEYFTSEYLSRVLLSRGHGYLSNGEPAKAIADYSEIVTLADEHENADWAKEAKTGALEWRGLARGLYLPAADRNVPAAIADVEEAADMNPKRLGLPALRTLVQWRCFQRREWRDGAKAVQYAKLLCERTENKNADDLIALAGAHAENGEKDEAVKWMDEAITLSPDNVEYRAVRDHFGAGNKPPYPN